jgi:hypothetical protein
VLCLDQRRREAATIPPVTDSIGEKHLGTFARHQIEVARRDPRGDRGRGAMVADFFAAMEEAERWREMTTWGLRELEQAVAHEEARLGVSRIDPDLSPENREILQNAWERAEMARAELANECPYVHAVTLISMHSGLDALVDELVPGAQQIVAGSIFEAIRERVESKGDASWDDISEDHRDVKQSSGPSPISFRRSRRGRGEAERSGTSQFWSGRTCARRLSARSQPISTRR